MNTMENRDEAKEGGKRNTEGMYESDLSSSSNRSSDGYFPTNSPTSSSSDSEIVFSSDEDISSEDVEEHIDFIRQKQGILKRASDVLFDHEGLYEASTARATSKMKQLDAPPGNIWAHAKKLVPQKKAPPRRIFSRKSPRGSLKGDKKTVQPNPRDPTINLERVGLVDAGAFDESNTSDEGNNSDNTDGLPEVSFARGQWMAQALIRSSSSFNASTVSNPDECRWRVVSDPVTCSLGLVPPPSVSMENGISIEDALKFSEEGHLLTQATPPFCVVYVNKAFMVLFGLTSKETLIGKPVESVLQVTQDILNSPKPVGDDDDFISAQFLRSQIVPTAPEDDSSEDEDVINCRMMIVPVMDRTRRRRLMPNSRQSKPYSCMSHVLVRIRETDHSLSPASSMVNVHLDDLLAVSSDSESKKDYDSSSSSADDSIRSNMVETVG